MSHNVYYVNCLIQMRPEINPTSHQCRKAVPSGAITSLQGLSGNGDRYRQLIAVAADGFDSGLVGADLIEFLAKTTETNF